MCTFWRKVTMAAYFAKDLLLLYISYTIMSNTPQHNSLNWFEIPATDLDRAIAFYQQLLGTVRKGTFFGAELGLFEADVKNGGIGGSIVVRQDMQPSTQGSVIFLNTNGRLDEALAAVESAGGKILVPKMSLGDFGWSAIILDSEGNRVGLHQTIH